MSADVENTIIIGSDDESDNDDVVLIKEEIEVDSDDVIFLSETKAPPKLETVVADTTTTTHPCDAKPLSRSLSISSGAGKLSLEDDSDSSDLSLNHIPQLNSLSNSTDPLDLSAKSCDTGNNSQLVGMTVQDLTAPSVDTSTHDLQTVQANSSLVFFDTSTDNAKTTGSMCNFNCSSLEDVCNGTNSKQTPSTPSSGSNMQVFTYPLPNKDTTKPVMGNSAGISCLSQDQNQEFSTNKQTRNTSDVTQVSSSSSSSSSSQLSTPVLVTSSSNVSPLDLLFPVPSSAPITGMLSIPVAHNNKVPTDDPYATSHFLLSSLDKCWQQMPSSGLNTALTTTSSDLGANMFITTIQNPFTVQPSAIVTTQATSSSMAQCSTSMSDVWPPKNNLSTTVDLSHISSHVGGFNIPSLQTAVPVGQPSTSAGLTSASNAATTNDTVLTSSSPITSLISTGSSQASQGTCGVTTVSSSSLITSLTPPTYIQQPMNTFFRMYNPLTLPQSMQQPPFVKSAAVTSTGNSSSKDTLVRSVSKGATTRSYSPTHGSFSLPLKKQRRYCSSGFYANVCTSCKVSPSGETFSKCPNGHSVCPECLKERVKLVLAGKTKECVKCLNRSCDSFYAISELKMSLPPMVVEILEDKLDQDYVDYISDMMLKKASNDIDNEDGTMEMEAGESTPMNRYMEREGRKIEDYPAYWTEMEETQNGYEMVQLEEHSDEYETVVIKFFESMVDHNVEITDVFRVQNPIQWKYFTVKKTEMLQENQGYGGVAEEQLFHGTSASVVDAICRKGFDWRLCGKHGTLYGQGSYFARHASYSHQYTDLKQSQRIPRRSSMILPPHMTMGLPNSPFFPSLNTGPISNIIVHSVSFGQGNTFRPINLSNHPTSIPSSSSASSSFASSSSFPSSSSSSMTQQPSSSGSTNHPIVSAAQGSGLAPAPPAHQLIPPPAGNSTLLTSQDQGCVSFGKFVSNSQPGNTMGAQSSRVPVTNKFQVLPKPVPVKKIIGLPSSSVFNVKSAPDPPKARMFLGRVLVGKFVGGSPKLRKPPPLCPKEEPYGKCYDSCVDDVNNPKIFVIFDSTQAYPEYLIEYSFVNDYQKFQN